MAQPGGGISVDSRLFERVLESLCNASSTSTTSDGVDELSHHEERQQALLELLNTRALEHFNQERLLFLSTAAKFFRVAEILYQRRREFDQALDCYISDKARQSLVFAYIKQILGSRNVSVEEKKKLIEAVLQHLEDLICIDSRETTQLLTVNLGTDLTEAVNRVIRYNKQNSATFDFLQCLFEMADSSSGELGSDDWQFEPSVYERYIELLCQRSVLEVVVAFLRSHDGYRLTKTLEICRRFHMSEASVVVLEKSGDVSGAFEVALRSLCTKLSVLVKSDSLHLDKFKPVHATVETVIALLNRNSQRLEQLQLRLLWFSLFDLLIDNYNRLFSSKADVSRVDESGNNSTSFAECGLGNARDTYRSILQHTVSCMVSYVPFTAVLEHIVTLGDGEGIANCFGNVRELLSSVMDACHYQQSVYTTCTRIVHQDVNSALGALTVAARAPISPHLNICSACLQPLGEATKSDQDAVCFQCGHAFHRLCLRDSARAGKAGDESGTLHDRQRYCVICCRSRTRFTVPYARSRVVGADDGVQSECESDTPDDSTSQPLMYSDSVEQLRLCQRTPSRLQVLSELAQLEQTKMTRYSNTAWNSPGMVLGRSRSALQGEKFSLKLAPPPVQ